MLRNRTLLAAFRQTLEHGRPPTTSRAQTLLPPLPQVQRNVIGRLQQRGISQISRNKATVRPLSTASWQTFVRSPTRLFRRYSDQPTQSLSDKFEELSRKYGWAAVGIYFGLSALDFPFCFLAVRLIGPDRIGEAEHAVVNAFWRLVGKFAPSMRPEHRAVIEGVDVTEAKENVEIDAKAHKENASKSSKTSSRVREVANSKK